MRFFMFLIVLLILTLVVLYVTGSNSEPALRTIEQEIELEAK